MIEIVLDQADDPAFTTMMRAIAVAVGLRCRPHDLIIVKIDSWFGPRWLGFAGKVFGGTAGMHDPSLRLPPFTPARVRKQWTLRPPAFESCPRGYRIHQWVRTGQATWRRFPDAAPDAVVLWFSGATATNRRGSIMVYARERTEAYGWYAGWLEKNGTWLPTQLCGISRSELLRLADPHPPLRILRADAACLSRP